MGRHGAMSFNVMENLPKKLMISGMIPPYTTHLGCDLGMMAGMKTWWSTRGWKFTAAFFWGRVFIVWYSPQGKIMTILGALDGFYLSWAYSLLEDVFPMDPCMVNKENRPFCRPKKAQIAMFHQDAPARGYRWLWLKILVVLIKLTSMFEKIVA